MMSTQTTNSDFTVESGRDNPFSFFKEQIDALKSIQDAMGFGSDDGELIIVKNKEDIVVSYGNGIFERDNLRMQYSYKYAGEKTEEQIEEYLDNEEKKFNAWVKEITELNQNAG